MKHILLLILLVILTSSVSYNNECEVVNFYEEVNFRDELKTLHNDEIIDVKILLKQYDFDNGVYNIEVSQIATDIYKIDNTEYYIETNNCYDNAYHDEAVLKVEFGEDPVIYFDINKIF